MSLQSAENFITSCYEHLDSRLQDIMKNVNSKFESKETKIFYICERAKECGYNFTPKELMIALKSAKNNFKKTTNFMGTTKSFNNKTYFELFNDTKKFWNSF